jgi:hypothetical protein
MKPTLRTRAYVAAAAVGTTVLVVHALAAPFNWSN